MVARGEEEHEEREEEESPSGSGHFLVVGNYCHDVIFLDGRPIGESLGGAVAFISNVLDALPPAPRRCRYISKVGPDFAYAVTHPPIRASGSSPTTLFHALFSSRGRSSDYHGDRILKRVLACDPISPRDLPSFRFEFGLAVGVGGEISPETLARMLDICRAVFVDVQALIRTFDPIDGAVRLVPLRDSGFFHLLPRIGFLKVSADEAPFVDVETARKCCCVVVTDGKDGCRVYWKEGELQVAPFPTVQVDPTGAGDSFLGGFAAGLACGLTLPDAALLGNFFGSLTVAQIGVPNFDKRLLEKIKDKLDRKKKGCINCVWRQEFTAADFRKSQEHEEFQSSLLEAAKLILSIHDASTEGYNQNYECEDNATIHEVIQHVEE